MPYSPEKVEGLVSGEFTVWRGAKRERLSARSWYELRAHVERTGRIDPGEDRPDAEAFLEVIDLERALSALNAKPENGRHQPSERWRMEAAMVLTLRMEGFSLQEIASVMKGRNVFVLATRAQRWIADYLSGKEPKP